MLEPTKPDLGAVKQRQQAAWASGDFAVVAARIVLVAEHLCDTADLQAGWRVLDVATGSGNAAIDGRLRRQRELGQQQAVDLVRRRAGGQRLLQRRRQRAGLVVDRAERARDRKVVAGVSSTRALSSRSATKRVTSDVLPIPGSPVTTTTRPSPRAAATRASASTASAPSRSRSCMRPR